MWGLAERGHKAVWGGVGEIAQTSVSHKKRLATTPTMIAMARSMRAWSEFVTMGPQGQSSKAHVEQGYGGVHKGAGEAARAMLRHVQSFVMALMTIVTV
jgi:hypothetical protein